MKQYVLGDICSIIKGITGIKKAIPGKYPLVVTAEGRLSNNEFQFDTEAVCIPLVSSTGHGHASLKRIHYQKGKFALSNILAAVIPNNFSQLNAEYLYYYLMFYKDNKIVPLMKGAANVSLTINSLKTIIIDIPDIEQQKEIVKKIRDIQLQIKDLSEKYKEQSSYISHLKTSILQDAIMGKLVNQNPNDALASELLKRIKAEKEQLIKDGKLKKEKPLPPITDDEKPFDLPKGWVWTRFQDAILYSTDYVANGSFASLRDNVKTYKSKNYALLVKTQDFANNFQNDLTYIDKNSYEFLSKSKLYGGELMLSNIGASIGKIFTIPELNMPMSIAPNSIIVKCSNDISSKWINFIILSHYGQKLLKDFTAGTAMPKFSKTQLRECFIPLPPLAEQKRIVEKIEEFMKLCDNLEKENISLQKKSQLLLNSIMKEAFTDKKQTCKIHDINAKRAILSAQIINELYNEKYFGAVKLEKIIYLCENHLNLDLGGNYKKEVAGPHDAKSRYEVEEYLKNSKWFNIHKERIGNIEKIKYIPLENVKDISENFSKCFDNKCREIVDLIDLLRGKNSDYCEAIATLYAVWKERFIKNLSCSDMDIIADFKKWNDSKLRFYDSDLQDTLLFMRRKNLTPISNLKK